MKKQIFEAKKVPDFSNTNKSFMKNLFTFYKEDIKEIHLEYHEFLKILQQKLNLQPLSDISGLDVITFDTLRPFLSEEEIQLWTVGNDTKSQIFYKYFYERFYFTAKICIIYIKSKDSFVSNCSLLDSYMIIERGISGQDVANFTPTLKSYLNSLYDFYKNLEEMNENYDGRKAQKLI